MTSLGLYLGRLLEHFLVPFVLFTYFIHVFYMHFILMLGRRNTSSLVFVKLIIIRLSLAQRLI